MLVPCFDPSKDDLHVSTEGSKISELVTRLILNTSGSAFAKLQLHDTELSTNDAESVHKLIELLGGQWGQTGLERCFYHAERGPQAAAKVRNMPMTSSLLESMDPEIDAFEMATEGHGHTMLIRPRWPNMFKDSKNEC